MREIQHRCKEVCDVDNSPNPNPNPNWRYLTSTTLEELAGTACADVSVQILVWIANVDPWAQGGSPVRWVQLDDMTTSLSEIGRSFRGIISPSLNLNLTHNLTQP